MNYYYDIALNMSDKSYMFYEWDEEDSIEVFKRIPFFQVTSNTLKDFYNNKIKVNNEFLEVIKNKAKGTNSSYIALFADKNGAIALEFLDNGCEIARSYLQVDDEVNVFEILYTTNVYDIAYEVIEAIPYKSNLRSEDNIKLLINTEIKSLIKDKKLEKLKYLYMEWFNKECDDISLIEKEMYDKLNNKITLKEIKIYELIKLSYSKV